MYFFFIFKDTQRLERAASRGRARSRNWSSGQIHQRRERYESCLGYNEKAHCQASIYVKTFYTIYCKGYVLALDMTARQLQEKLKKQGHPWLLAKGFDTSCPISDFIPKAQVTDVNNLNLKLSVNGALKQNGNTGDMIYKLPTLIAYISKYFKLDYGDLILTGTPSGVSSVRHGDVIEANLSDLVKIKYSVVELPSE